MSFHVIIPSRIASTRLPGKPLLDIAGKPMVLRVYERAVQSAAESVTVATDDQSIADVVREHGANVCMTSPDHPSGTDRLAEVVARLDLEDGEIVVNVQGDEPLIPPGVINQVASNLNNRPDFDVATLCEPIHDREEFLNPSAVKVVADKAGKALYFSRASIPWPRDIDMESETLPADVIAQRHIGLYAYRVGLLNRFVRWEPTPLEKLESLEQLRILENGGLIHVQQAIEEVPAGVDTKEDLDRVRRVIASDFAEGDQG